MKRLACLMILILLLAACSDENPPADGDPPLLSGFDAMPKELATVALTATPTPVLESGATVSVAMITSTPEPPRPTATLTPYAGVFMGEPTSDGSEEEGDDEPLPTLAPYVVNPGIGGPVVGGSGIGPSGTGGACNIPVTATFANAYNSNTTLQEKLGCPVNGGSTVQLVMQPFERGEMIWRDTRQIYALAASGQFWQVADAWLEGMPADDPAFAPPGGLIQPVRGFGLVWRSNQSIRDALGWGTLSEAPYTGTWQDFERGAMLVGGGGRIYAIYTAEGQHSGPLS